MDFFRRVVDSVPSKPVVKQPPLLYEVSLFTLSTGDGRLFSLAPEKSSFFSFLKGNDSAKPVLQYPDPDVPVLAFMPYVGSMALSSW